MRIAVVIPTLNESANITATLASLKCGRPNLIVVADCDSTDATAELARAAGADVLTDVGLCSRGAALQAGWSHVQNQMPEVDTVWFLHGDTVAPRGWRDEIEVILQAPSIVGGAFTQRFNFANQSAQRPSWIQRRLLRFVIFCNRTRYRFTHIYFGDQGIFVRAKTLKKIGGVPQSPLMEDVDLCQQLLKHGPLRLSRARLSTSPRRFLKHGIIRQLLHDWLLLLTHRLGLRPQALYARYNADNHRHAPAA